MRVDIEILPDGRGRVAPHGEIDLAGAPRLREALSDVLAGGHTDLVMDLRAVTFIDSTGLGLLVGVGKKAYGLGGSLTIVCDNDRVLRLLAITGISRTLPVQATLGEPAADRP